MREEQDTWKILTNLFLTALIVASRRRKIFNFSLRIFTNSERFEKKNLKEIVVRGTLKTVTIHKKNFFKFFYSYDAEELL